MTLKHSHTMTTKLIIIAFLTILLGSCRTYSPDYLPTSDMIDINHFGSYIIVFHKAHDYTRGELIAIDSSHVFVLSEETNTCIKIPIDNVEKFNLKYAETKHYGWTIPVSTLVSLSHGALLLITAPINLIVSISVTSNAEKAFQYSDKEMTFEKLKMFARFPQGIPPKLNLSSIK